MKKYWSGLLLLVLFSYACTKTVDPTPEEIGYTYFPLEVGHYRVYNVTETVWNMEDSVITRYQIRERIDTIFHDQSGQIAYKMIRSRRNDPDKNWRDDSVIVVNRTNADLRVTRNNRQKVELAFPVNQNRSWNTNAFNTLGEEDNYYTNLRQPFTVSGKTYDNTVTVMEANIKNAVEKDDRWEVYGNNIGLIYKNFTRLTYCNSSDPSICEFGVDEIIAGVRRIYELESYGVDQ